MEQLNNQPFPMRPPPVNAPPGVGNPMPPIMMMGNQQMNFPAMRAPFPGNVSQQQEKKNEFKRGIFVSGFEKMVTSAMIQKHFSIKPINGLKHPLTKLRQSKGFAFIYYGSEDDAMYVKKTLDRTAILREKVRITRTVISENLSKMMFKLKTAGLSQKQVQENETNYFNDENLENEVQRIIKPLFGTNVQVNKITIPRSKSEKKPLRYARVFFYVSDVKAAKNIADQFIRGNAEEFAYDTTGKNEYEIILNCISLMINKDDKFGKIAKSEIYEYTKKNQSNVLHLKGVKANQGEDATALADEIKEYMQRQGLQWNIVNAYAAIHEKRGAWANLTFSSYEETVQAYEHLKTLRPKFRDGVLYGSLRNVKDPRTVVISVVRKEVTENDVEKFLNDLASKSVKQQTIPGEENYRKYDYFSFNIIESKKFFKIDGDETKGITESEIDQIHPSWIEINEVPRRLIIHFFHQFNDEDIKELNNDITVTPNYDNIFLKGDKNRQLRSNHQKGHVNKDGIYIKHTEIKGKKKQKTVRQDRPARTRPEFAGNRGGQMGNRQGPTRPGMDFSMGGMPGGNKQPPKTTIPNMRMQGAGGFRPQIGAVGSLGGVPPPMRPQGPFNPASNMPPSNVPPSNLPPANLPPPSNMPPANMPPSNLPPSNLPPMGMQGFKPSFQPQNPMGMPPPIGGPGPQRPMNVPPPGSFPPNMGPPNMGPPKPQPPPPSKE